jgi:carbonic anhydrase
MHVTTAHFIFTALAVCLPIIGNTGVNAAQGTQWGYEGTYNPSNWPSVNENCGKKSQSPIDITPSQTTLDDHLDEIFLTASGDQDLDAVATNNGHTVNLGLSTTYRVSGGKLSSSYRVAGVHFHWGKTDSAGSEHTVNGKPYPLEMHIVSYDEEHYDAITDAMKETNGLAVIGLLFQVSPTDNPYLKQLTDRLSQVESAGNSTTVPLFDLISMLPTRLTDYYRYSGSLTTPACYESVIWTVLRSVSNVSQSQLDSFRNLLQGQKFTSHKLEYNWRPTQPLNGRTVYRSFFIPPMMEGAPGHDTNSATDIFSKGIVSALSAALFSTLYNVIRA